MLESQNHPKQSYDHPTWVTYNILLHGNLRPFWDDSSEKKNMIPGFGRTVRSSKFAQTCQMEYSGDIITGMSWGIFWNLIKKFNQHKNSDIMIILVILQINEV